MPFDFSSYTIEDHEHPASAGKYNNALTAIQQGLNLMPVSNLAGYPGDGDMYLNGAGGWGQPTTDLVVAYRKTDTTLIADTTAASDLFGGFFAIAANKLSTSGSIRIFAGGNLQNDTGNDRTILLSLLLGATPLWTSAVSAAISAHSAFRAWRLKCVIQSMGANLQQGGGLFLISHFDKPTTGTGAIRQSNAEILLAPFQTIASNVDMAANQAIILRVTLSAKDPALSMSCLRARVEVTV